MTICIGQDYEEMSSLAAELIIRYVKRKPESLVCFAAGNTPIGTFKLLVDAECNGGVSFRQCRFISLDEWVGLDGNDEGSCRQTMDEHFFGPCGIPEEHIRFFDAKNPDLQQECQAMDDFIRSFGRIDLLLLGVGMNGHLGFNEPHVSFELYTHVTELDAVTKQVSEKYFGEQKELQQGITLGIKHFMEADTVIVVADGLKKAPIIGQALRDEVSSQVPATILQLHPDVHYCLDQAAASLLQAQS